MRSLEPAELLFGRDIDFGPIAAWLRGVAVSGTAALVTGPAGIGKTSLLRHAWDQSLDQGMLAVSATGGAVRDHVAVRCPAPAAAPDRAPHRAAVA